MTISNSGVASFIPSRHHQRRRQWHPTPVLSPGKSHGWRSLEGCSPWSRWGSNTTEWLHFHFSLSCLGEGMATHSSVLVWRIQGMAEPGGLPSMGSHRVGHDWSDLAVANISNYLEILIKYRSWFMKSRMESKTLHVWQPPSQYQCCWSGDHILNDKVL